MSDFDCKRCPESDDATLFGDGTGGVHGVKLAALRVALTEGEESGRADSFDMDTFLRGKRASYQARSRP